MILEIANKNHNSLLSQNMLEIMNLAYNNQEESPLAQMRYIRGAFETKEYHKLLSPEYRTLISDGSLF